MVRKLLLHLIGNPWQNIDNISEAGHVISCLAEQLFDFRLV